MAGTEALRSTHKVSEPLALRARQDLVELPRRSEEDQSTGERLYVADAITLQSMRVRRMERVPAFAHPIRRSNRAES